MAPRGPSYPIHAPRSRWIEAVGIAARRPSAGGASSAVGAAGGRRGYRVKWRSLRVVPTSGAGRSHLDHFAPVRSATRRASCKQVPCRARARAGRHGGRGRGAGRAPGPAGGGQDPAPRGRRGGVGALPARGPRRRAHPSREHRPLPGARKPGERRALHGARVPRRARSGADPRERGAAPGVGRGGPRARGARGPGLRARPRHRPPRPQAGEPVPGPPAGRRRGDQGARFRRRQVGRAGWGDDVRLGAPRVAALHVAGAVQERALGRPARRSLVDSA